MRFNAKNAAITAGLVFAALLSILVIAPRVTTTAFHAGTIASVEQNISTVLKLTGAATAASAAITLIPGDAATPIAMKLADYSTYFLVVLCVLYLEKYLVVLMGYLSFWICIPGACVSCIADLFTKSVERHRFFRLGATKLVLTGLLIFSMIPASVKISNVIMDIHRPSIENTLNSATELTEEIQDEVEGTEENQGILEKIMEQATQTFNLAIDGAEQLVKHYTEALAVMLVTSCLIPVLVFFLFLKLIKNVFGFRIPPELMAVARIPGYSREDRKQLTNRD